MSRSCALKALHDGHEKAATRPTVFERRVLRGTTSTTPAATEASEAKGEFSRQGEHPWRHRSLPRQASSRREPALLAPTRWERESRARVPWFFENWRCWEAETRRPRPVLRREVSALAQGALLIADVMKRSLQQANRRERHEHSDDRVHVTKPMTTRLSVFGEVEDALIGRSASPLPVRGRQS